MRMLLHEGVNPDTGETIILKATLETLTTAHVISDGVGTTEKSIVGYGLGWRRLSYHGHEVVSEVPHGVRRLLLTALRCTTVAETTM